ncbi:DNA topoisomerase IV [Flavobacterium sp.]|uniref:DNA topoisomerase IV n=1 Tax=Flavobacterium sp. TaxID=239 RepID=UPI00286E7DBC|nr:DNA topoisomerase IV [Flavobacterium sp.]
MNKKIIILPLLLLLLSCYNQERNCRDFKTGKFSFTQKIDSIAVTSTFERTETLQIERFEGKTDSATVRWINDCEFVLQKINPKNREERKAISMKILTTNEKTYTFEYSFVGEAKKQKGTVTKMN